MKVHFLYWRINFTIFWRCKVTYYNSLRCLLILGSSISGHFSPNISFRMFITYQNCDLPWDSRSLFNNVRQFVMRRPWGVFSVRGTLLSLPAVTSWRMRMLVLR